MCRRSHLISCIECCRGMPDGRKPPSPSRLPPRQVAAFQRVGDMCGMIIRIAAMAPDVFAGHAPWERNTALALLKQMPPARILPGALCDVSGHRKPANLQGREFRRFGACLGVGSPGEVDGQLAEGVTCAWPQPGQGDRLWDAQSAGGRAAASPSGGAVGLHHHRTLAGMDEAMLARIAKARRPLIHEAPAAPRGTPASLDRPSTPWCPSCRESAAPCRCCGSAGPPVRR